MTREDILKNGLCIELNRMVKQYSNDADLGQHVRVAVLTTEEKLKELSKEEKLKD